MKSCNYLILTSLAILIATTSCRKNNYINNDLPFLIGDYDWVYTKNSEMMIWGDISYSYLTNTEVSSSYGLRITEKNKLFFFENSVEYDSFKFNMSPSYNNMTNESYVFYGKNNKSGNVMAYSGDTLWIYSFPFEGFNYFIKK